MLRHFKRTIRTRPEIPTASLPDIVFLLLCFFMVSTVLRKTENLVNVRLPEAEAIQKIEQKRLVSYVYIGRKRIENSDQLGETAVQIDDALIEDVSSIRTIMYNKLMEQPKLIVSLRVDEDASMGAVTDVQQEFREAGTLRINYSTKRQNSP